MTTRRANVAACVLALASTVSHVRKASNIEVKRWVPQASNPVEAHP
ncbi:MAG: hypothetical protein P0Y64_12530 [Candidatus Sphingomonas colombiensis]|nr:hypothetical protein [Sphingomonas sp.]WEK42218.1 MAG: hypothetical protein P0Y64_12530 [Sphingomonas sp.]